MEEWQQWAMALAAELALRGEVRLSGEGEEFLFTLADAAALGLLVVAAGPDRTAEVVCSWLERARSAAARPMGDA